MGSVFLRGDSWVGEYRVNGKTRRKTFGKKGIVTKTSAKEMLRKIEQKIKLGQYDMLDVEIPTVNEFAVEYLAFLCDVKKIRSHNRSRQCLDYFTTMYGDKRMNEVDADDMDIYQKTRLNQKIRPKEKTALSKLTSLGTVVRELAVIKNFFNYARKKKWGKTIENPVQEIPTVDNKQARILTFEEEPKLMSLIAHLEDLKDVIDIDLNSGMREGEILGLEWPWVNLDTNIIFLPQTNTKQEKINKISINEIVRAILLKRKLKSGGSKFVFPSPKKPNTHRKTIYHTLQRYCKKAGIKMRTHDFRHTVATRLVDAGVPLHAVSKLLGHSSIRTTERYSHPEESVKKGTDILAQFSRNRDNIINHEEPKVDTIAPDGFPKGA